MLDARVIFGLAIADTELKDSKVIVSITMGKNTIANLVSRNIK